MRNLFILYIWMKTSVHPSIFYHRIIRTVIESRGCGTLDKFLVYSRANTRGRSFSSSRTEEEWELYRWRLWTYLRCRLDSLYSLIWLTLGAERHKPFTRCLLEASLFRLALLHVRHRPGGGGLGPNGSADIPPPEAGKGWEWHRCVRECQHEGRRVWRVFYAWDFQLWGNLNL